MHTPSVVATKGPETYVKAYLGTGGRETGRQAEQSDRQTARVTDRLNGVIDRR